MGNSLLFDLIHVLDYEGLNGGECVNYEEMTPEELEAEADRILAGDLQNRQSNKVRLSEYPILSTHQLERRRRREVPFTSLGVWDKAELGIPVD